MNHRLYVGNLSFDVDSDVLRSAFAEMGEIQDLAIITERETGRSRGFAFVTMSTEDGARQAIAALNGSLLGGRALRVVEAEERADTAGRGRRSDRPAADGDRHANGLRRW